MESSLPLHLFFIMVRRGVGVLAMICSQGSILGRAAAEDLILPLCMPCLKLLKGEQHVVEGLINALSDAHFSNYCW